MIEYERMSDLLREAMVDYRRVKALPNARMAMDHWHDPDYEFDDDDEAIPICLICLAGAWLHVQDNLSIEHYNSPGMQDHTTARYMRTLDFLRQGLILPALEMFTDTEYPERSIDVPDSIDVPTYDRHDNHSVRAWEQSMDDLVDKLEKWGL